jgi:polyphosphate kinase
MASNCSCALRPENKVKIGSVENTEIEGVIDLNDPALYFNRELSLLEFNDRVLAQAKNENLPLLERLNYL